MTKRYIITATLEGYKPKYYCKTNLLGQSYENDKNIAFKFDDLVECCKVIVELKERWTWLKRPVWEYVEVK